MAAATQVARRTSFIPQNGPGRRPRALALLLCAVALLVVRCGCAAAAPAAPAPSAKAREARIAVRELWPFICLETLSSVRPRFQHKVRIKSFAGRVDMQRQYHILCLGSRLQMKEQKIRERELKLFNKQPLFSHSPHSPTPPSIIS